MHWRQSTKDLHMRKTGKNFPTWYCEMSRKHVTRFGMKDFDTNYWTCDNLYIPAYWKFWDYLKYRTAKIVIGNEPGEPFTLDCGVPQGGCLSPTLYTFYNSDMPTPDADDPKEENVSYADDLTQIITYPTGSFRMLASYTQRAIQRMNAYEKRWKIKTNQEKFNIIYMFRINRKTVSCIHTEDGLLRYSEHGKVLGLKLNSKGLHQ